MPLKLRTNLAGFGSDLRGESVGFIRIGPVSDRLQTTAMSDAQETMSQCPFRCKVHVSCPMHIPDHVGCTVMADAQKCHFGCSAVLSRMHSESLD